MFEKLIKLYKKPRLIIIDIILINLALFLSYLLRFDYSVFNNIEIEYFLVITLLGIFALYITDI